jgi:hypothetical protein
VGGGGRYDPTPTTPLILTLGAAEPTQPGENQVVEKATPLPLKWGIPDESRSITAIFTDPLGHYGATCDGYGRVLLLSLVQNIILRMFKGYRDAQCGWLQIKHDSKDPHQNGTPLPPGLFSRETGVPPLFLVIYGGRRGVLEVWRVPYGERVAIFDVGVGCR